MKQIQIIGNLGFDAVIRETAGNKYVTFSVAVDDSYKDKDGNKVERTDWISCVTRQLSIASFLKKGTKVFCQGKPDVKVYEGKDKVHRASISLNCNAIQLLSAKREESNTTTDQGASNTSEAPPIEDDNLPF